MSSDPFRTFAQTLRHHASVRPDALALTLDDRSSTFAELHHASNRAANALLARGIGKGDRVAILSRNRSEFFELIFACSKIGAILVGLNWRLAVGEVAAILADAAPALLVYGPDEENLARGSAGALFERDAALGLGERYEIWRNSGEPSDPGHDGAPDEIILVLYTSGTTGLPKGVMLTNRAMSHTRRLAEAWGMSERSVNLVAMPMFHIGGCGYGSSTMMAGGHTVLMREVNPALTIELIARHGVTHCFFVPTVVKALLAVPGIDKADLSSLELLMYGASPIDDTLLQQALKMLRCGFMHAYGMTEAAGTVTFLAPRDHDPGGPRAHLLRSVGKPLPWVDLRIVDPATGADKAAGEVGEIWLRSGMTMAGYWNKPEATGEAIVGGEWFRTGDAAYRNEDGYVFLVDRYKDMIISGGENIYPAEIENVLAAHPAIREVGVIGIDHSRWGETPLAVIALWPGASADAEEIRGFVRERLAHYKCPSRIEFVEALPRNASGKLLKHEMRRTWRQPAPSALSLVRRWVNDYFNRHDASSAAAFIAPDYALEIGNVILAGRDSEWLPAVARQMALFPGMGMTVHRTVAGQGWAAAWFSEHGASGRKEACWSGIGIWYSDGPFLTRCIAQEDYMTRQRQLRTGMADPVEPPVIAPWDAAALPASPQCEAVLREWLAGDWPKAGPVRCDDEHITGIPLVFEVSSTELRFIGSSGSEVVFHARQTGICRGGLPKAPPPVQATLFINGIVRVEDGRIQSGRVIRDRLGLQSALMEMAR